MKYALIRGGIVENVVVADSGYIATLAGFDHIEALDTDEEQKIAGPGWWYDVATRVFTAPDAVSTQEVCTLTHKSFRDRLSFDEQVLLDNFTVAEYAAVEPKIQSLTVMQRAQVRTAIATYKESQEIDLDDPATVRFITLLGDLGLLDGPGRAGEILGEGH